MVESIRRLLPPVLQDVVGDVFDQPAVRESHATCATCAMCDHGQASPVAMDYFLAETKCCTFHPQLPNYLVGAILADPNPDMAEGKRRVREVIANRMGTLPLRLARPRKLAFLMTNYSEAFGRSKSLVCPYFDAAKPDQSCTIWRHREAVCMTWFCKYEGGQRGFEFWSALKSYLFFAQRTLALAARQAVDGSLLEPDLVRDLITAEDMDDLPPKDARYASWWGKWLGREEEFYLKTYEWVRSISRADFRQNVDGRPEGKRLHDALGAAYSTLQNKILPSRLVRNPRMMEAHTANRVVVTTYHRYDSFALDKDLFEVVGLFNTELTLAENLEHLSRDEGIELTPDLIEYLFAAGILIEPGLPPPPDDID